jgi:methyl-accepting chemotaxis protein
MFKNIKVGTKLIGSFLVVVAILATVALIGYVNIKSIAGRGHVMYSQNTVAIEEMGSLIASLEKMRGDIYRYIDVPADRQKMGVAQDEAISFVNETIKTYRNRNISASEKKIIDDFDAAWPEMQRGYRAIMKVADVGNMDEVNNLLSADNYVFKARVKTFAAIRALNELNRKNADAANKANGDAASKASLAVLVATILAIIVALALGLILTNSITGPLKRGVWLVQEMGKGHLSERLNLKRKDEIGILTQEMDTFADNLQKYVVKGMQEVSEGNVDIETPVMDDRDEIGPALKRMVETLKAMGNEMKMLTMSAMEGKLDVRGNDQDFKGVYQDAIKGVNKTLNAVMGPINEASDVLVQIANKDMTARVKGDYRGDHAKIKESINMAVENLEKALQQVAIGAEQVASASVEVSTGGQSLSQGASEQASSLEEISSNLQEMSSMTKQNALNAGVMAKNVC